jgi:hypothetical protein
MQSLTKVLRPFKIVPGRDERPAVQVDNGGKKQNFVRTSSSLVEQYSFSFSVRGRTIRNGADEDEANCRAVLEQDR